MGERSVFSGGGTARWPWPTSRGPTMRPPSRTKTRVALVVVAAGVGFMVAVQARQIDDRSARLAAETPEDLTRILADLNAEADRLSRSVSSLRLKLERYQSSTSNDGRAVRDAQKTLADLQVLAGIRAASGPGVTVRIVDPQSSVGWEAMPAQEQPKFRRQCHQGHSPISTARSFL